VAATSPGSEERRQRRYQFGEFTLDLETGFLRRQREPVDVRAKAFDLLAYLVQRHGCVVTKDELVDAVWPGVAVTDNSLAQCMAEVRRVLGDDDRNIIRTIPRRGYVFAAEVAGADDDPPLPADTAIRVDTPSIAVLPFLNLTADPDSEYFSDGLAEDILDLLTRVPRLKVIARTSSFAFKGRNEDVREIARALGVGHVLEGSIRKSGNRIRISAQLIAGADGSHVWSQRYDRELADVFVIQDEIADAITASLRVELGDRRQRDAMRATTNLEAHQLYLKGRFQWGKRTAKALHTAIRHYEDAIAIAPAYAPAYAGLAECYVPLAYYGHMRPRDAWPKARAAAQQALGIDPTVAEARTVLAWTKTHLDHDPVAGEAELRAAIADDPDYSRARQALAEHLVATGRFEEAGEQIRRALVSDPIALNINAAVGLIDYFSGRADRAVGEYRRTIDLDAYFYPTHWYLGLALEQCGRFDEAADALAEAGRLSDRSTAVLAALGVVRAATNDVERARAVLDELNRLSETNYVSQVFVAAILVRLGDLAGALGRLDQAFDDQCPWLLFSVVDPKLAPLRSHVRFHRLIRRLGLGTAAASHS
jgi:adenylate cyclase